MPSLRTRFVELQTSFMFSDIDAQVSPGPLSHTRCMPGNQTSHVFLSACGGDESAYEVNERGIFTRALLKVLESAASERISCDELVKKLVTLPSYVPVILIDVTRACSFHAVKLTLGNCL